MKEIQIKTGVRAFTNETDASEELSGYADLGMKREAMERVRRILSKPRMFPSEFAEAIRVIGFLSDPEKWRVEIEAAYSRHNRSFQQRVRHLANHRRRDLMTKHVEAVGQVLWQLELERVFVLGLLCGNNK